MAGELLHGAAGQAEGEQARALPAAQVSRNLPGVRAQAQASEAGLKSGMDRRVNHVRDLPGQGRAVVPNYTPLEAIVLQLLVFIGYLIGVIKERKLAETPEFYNRLSFKSANTIQLNRFIIRTCYIIVGSIES